MQSSGECSLVAMISLSRPHCGTPWNPTPQTKRPKPHNPPRKIQRSATPQAAALAAEEARDAAEGSCLAPVETLDPTKTQFAINPQKM